MVVSLGHWKQIALTSIICTCWLVIGCKQLPLYSSGETDVAVSPQAITAGNVSRLADIRKFTVSDKGVVGGDFSPADPALITILDADGLAQTWDAQQGEMLHEVYDHMGTGLAVAYSPDGKRLITGGKSIGLDIKVWDTTTDTETTTVSMTGYNAYDASWAPNGEHFALVSRGASRVFIYNSDGTDHAQRRMSDQWLWAVAYGGDYLATISQDGNVYLYQGDTYRYTAKMRHSVRSAGRDLAFSPDETMLAACFVDGTVEIWNTADWSSITTFVAHPPGTSIMAGCRDGEFARGSDVFFSVGDDATLLATDPRTGEELNRISFADDVLMLSISADGSLIAVGLKDGTVHILGLPN
jgi:WD40 repeat protein